MPCTINKQVVADRTANRYCPLDRTICEQRHLPVPIGQLMELLRLLLKLRTVYNFRQVIHEPLVVNLFVEIARVHLESLCESSRRVTVAEVQETIRFPRILTPGQLGGDVLYAIVLDVFHEQLVAHENAIDVEQQ